MSKIHQGNALKEAVKTCGKSATEVAKSIGLKSRKSLYNLYNTEELHPKYIKKLSEIGINLDIEIKKPNITHNAKLRTNGSDVNNCYVVPVKAFGGFLSGYQDPVFLESLHKTSFPLVRGECFMFEVDGDSMIKDGDSDSSYIPGSWVVGTLLESFDYLQKNKCYIFQTTDGIIIKQFSEIKADMCYLKSLNTDSAYKMPGIHLKSIKKVYFIEYKIKKP